MIFGWVITIWSFDVGVLTKGSTPGFFFGGWFFIIGFLRGTGVVELGLGRAVSVDVDDSWALGVWWGEGRETSGIEGASTAEGTGTGTGFWIKDGQVDLQLTAGSLSTVGELFEVTVQGQDDWIEELEVEMEMDRTGRYKIFKRCNGSFQFYDKSLKVRDFRAKFRN